MRLFILSDPSNIHTKRWVSSLSKKGIDIFLFGLNQSDSSFYEHYSNVTTFSLDITSSLKNKEGIGSFEKVKYLFCINILKKKILEFRPDILHAHFASSYGLLGSLINFHPYIISVWGTDVYGFPNVSFVHKRIFKYILSKADLILSTSHAMKKETQKYTNKHIGVTPFGVDIQLFNKCGIADQHNTFIIGNVKTLLPNYGIDILIEAFKIVVERNFNRDIKLVIIGDGKEKENLIQLSKNLNVNDRIDFLGKIDNNLLPHYYNSFSVAVFPSRTESFGVVAVEAMACECPVIASNAEGFSEVIVDGETGYIVPKDDPLSVANAIQKFIDNEGLRYNMGCEGRKRVEKLYDWSENVNEMMKIYNQICKADIQSKI